MDGLVNARDLGGLPRTGGGETPYGVFFRSEIVDRVTPSGWDQMYEAGIRSVIDLRTPGERARDVHDRPDWLTTVAVDLDGAENREFWPYFEDSGLDGTPLVFLPHLAAMPERMGAVLTALAEAPEGGVLFHCMSGRDRTGLTAMVLLHAAGVRPEAVADDYLQTARLGGGFALTTDAQRELILIDELLGQHGTTAERALLAAFEGLRLEELHLSPQVRHRVMTWRGVLTHG
ncbi:protein-tyrosine-phosphatase [Kineosporia sp. NBRC 101731]|nr:protein-tyrosine-phosphatase [Kineosporia sp. NBRC 101731]